ncbi:MAG: AAA family ATPase [Nanoarchaeota archaeon]
MGLFDSMLKEGESLFLDPLPLDIEFTPPIIEGREAEQQEISTAIKPLFSKRSGKQVLITGAPGIGKTVATKYVLSELKKETDDIIPLYVNCWKKDTPYQIALDLCNQVGFRFVHNRDTTDLFKEIAKIVNKKSAVLVLDECDKVTDQQLLYTLLEEIYRKALILITNDDGWLGRLDSRVRSRLTPNIITFQPYTAGETYNILKNRVAYAFAPGVLDPEAFDMIVQQTAALGDIRAGLHLLKEAGEIAEYRAARKITLQHATAAVEKLRAFQTKTNEGLDDVEQTVLTLIKQHTGKTTREIYEAYQQQGGTQSYSNFHKKVKHLEKGKYISLREKNEGPGKSTIIEYGNRKLTDF